MNSSALTLLGAFDMLIRIIESERHALGKSFDPDAAIRTLEKVKSNLTTRALAYCQAEYHGLETFHATIDQLSKHLPQGSDLEKTLSGYKHCISTFLSHGPIPPWPSSSSSQHS